MLICNDQLDSAQLQALDKLSTLCLTADGSIPALYNHLLGQKRATASNVLYFQKEHLLGFLSVYFFYKDACEISLMVAPTHRRQGITKQLLHTILPQLLAKQINKLIFSAATLVNKNWLSQLGFQYQHSEYQMQRNSYEPILPHKQALVIQKAMAKDVTALCTIDKLCFATEHTDMMRRFTNLLVDNNYTVLIALHNEEIVGKAHLRWEAEGAIFSDIAIIPRYQGQGWGSELLVYCINQALILGKTKLSLDVETSNKNALNLYTRHGFKTINSHDYWTISIDKLQALVTHD